MIESMLAARVSLFLNSKSTNDKTQQRGARNKKKEDFVK